MCTRNATREVEVAGARKAREKTSIQWRRRMKSFDLYENGFAQAFGGAGGRITSLERKPLKELECY